MGGFLSKGVANLYLLLIPLVAVWATLLREVEGHKKILTDAGLHQRLASLGT